jgi:protein TonB
MNTEQAQINRWDDIVFENRNKEYGAYFIRNVYVRNVSVAMLISFTLAGTVLAYPKIVEFFKGKEEVAKTGTKIVNYTDLAAPPPINKNTPSPPKVEIPEVRKVIKFLPPKVTDKQVEEEEKMLTQEEAKAVETSPVDIEGTGTEVVFNEVIDEGKNEGPAVEEIFTIVEQMPEFPGGAASMMKFIGNNTKYPAVARRMGIEGTVFVSFVIDTEGKISEVNAIKGISPDCDKEAVRVIQTMPPWKAGKQNGKPVKVRFVVPIKFTLAT